MVRGTTFRLRADASPERSAVQHADLRRVTSPRRAGAGRRRLAGRGARRSALTTTDSFETSRSATRVAAVSTGPEATPRVLLDATVRPGGPGRRRALRRRAGRRALGRPAGRLVVVCQRSDAERFTRLAGDAAEIVAGPVRHLAPAGPAGLGADRPAAGRPAGRCRPHPLALLHDAAARAGAGRGDPARRHLLLRARAAQRGPHRLLPVGDPHGGPPGRARRRPVAGHPRRAGPAPRRRPGAHRRRAARRRPRHLPPADRTPSAAGSPTGSGCTAGRTSPSSVSSSAARTCPTWCAAGCARSTASTSRRCSCWPAAAAGTTASTRPSPRCPSHLKVVRPGFLRPADLPGLLGGAMVVAYPSKAEGFGLPVLEAMACGAAVLTARRLSLPEVGGDAVAYTEPDVDSIADVAARPHRRRGPATAAVAVRAGAGQGVHLGGVRAGPPRDLPAGRGRRPGLSDRPMGRGSPAGRREGDPAAPADRQHAQADAAHGGRAVPAPRAGPGARRRRRPRGARHVLPPGGVPGRHR